MMVFLTSSFRSMAQINSTGYDFYPDPLEKQRFFVCTFFLPWAKGWTKGGRGEGNKVGGAYSTCSKMQRPKKVGDSSFKVPCESGCRVQVIIFRQVLKMLEVERFTFFLCNASNFCAGASSPTSRPLLHHHWRRRQPYNFSFMCEAPFCDQSQQHGQPCS